MSGEYRTKQRELILKVLKQNSERHISADEIEATLFASGEPVGKATIYRCLDRLGEQGAVRKYRMSDGKGACYQLLDSSCKFHYHCKCTGCGKLLHVECGQLDSIGAHMVAHHGFVIDSAQTVFYGLCEKCSGGNTL